MTRSAQNVLEAESPSKGWEGAQLLVAGGIGAHTRWAAAEAAVPSRRTEWFGSRAVAENG